MAANIVAIQVNASLWIFIDKIVQIANAKDIIGIDYFEIVYTSGQKMLTYNVDSDTVYYAHIERFLRVWAWNYGGGE